VYSHSITRKISSDLVLVTDIHLKETTVVIPEQLRDVAVKLDRGTNPSEVTVREFLGWFSAIC